MNLKYAAFNWKHRGNLKLIVTSYWLVGVYKLCRSRGLSTEIESPHPDLQDEYVIFNALC